MDETIKKLVRQLFPELTGAYHLSRFGRVVGISDSTEQPELVDQFRPRLAVDVELLTPQLTKDDQFSVFKSLPVPVAIGGDERGLFGLLEEGTIVEVAFAYGSPKHPFIRSITGLNNGMPAIKPGEMIWQTHEGVSQKVDDQGNWTRETHGTIIDRATKAVSNALEKVETYLTFVRSTEGNSSETVGGIKLLKAIGALKLLSAGTLNIGSVDNMNLTTASDQNNAVGRDRNESIGNNETVAVKQHRSHTVSGNDSRTVKGSDTQTVDGARTTTIGQDDSTTISANQITDVTGNSTKTVGGTDTETVTGSKTVVAPIIALQAGTFTMGNGSGTDVLSLISSLMLQVKALAETVASHTHGNNGASPPSTAGSHNSQASAVNGLNSDLVGLMG